MKISRNATASPTDKLNEQDRREGASASSWAYLPHKVIPHENHFAQPGHVFPRPQNPQTFSLTSNIDKPSNQQPHQKNKTKKTAAFLIRSSSPSSSSSITVRPPKSAPPNSASSRQTPARWLNPQKPWCETFTARWEASSNPRYMTPTSSQTPWTRPSSQRKTGGGAGGRAAGPISPDQSTAHQGRRQTPCGPAALAVLTRPVRRPRAGGGENGLR